MASELKNMLAESQRLLAESRLARRGLQEVVAALIATRAVTARVRQEVASTIGSAHAQDRSAAALDAAHASAARALPANTGAPDVPPNPSDAAASSTPDDAPGARS